MDIERLKELKAKAKISNYSIAHLSGVPLGTVNKIMSGGTKSVKTETYLKIESAILNHAPCKESEAHNFGFYGVYACSPKVYLGEPSKNAQTVIEESNLAYEKGASLILFPELFLTGATLGDLYRQPTLIKSAEKALIQIINFSKSINTTIVIGLPLFVRGAVYNACAVVYNGKLLGFTPKSVSEGVFSAFSGVTTISFNGKEYPFGNIVYASGDFSFGVSYLSEVYNPQNSLGLYAQNGANAVCVVHASYETMLEPQRVKNILVSESARLNLGVISSGAGEGESTTDGVYSGRCLIVENGTVLSENKPFSLKPCYAQIDFEYLQAQRNKNGFASLENALLTVNYNLEVKEFKLERSHQKYPFIPETDTQSACINAVNIQARALAQRLNYIHGENLVLGISGGLDSTLAILVAVKAVQFAGKDIKSVIAITMPCFGTSKRTKNNAVRLCELLGVTLKEVNIKNAVLQHFADIEQNPDNADITYENSQARERTQVLMDYANKVNGIVVGTGDLSELALGWATYNGDHMSNYSVNGSIPKTLVKEIVLSYGAYLGGEIKEVLFDIADTPVSPELKPLTASENSQKTEDIVGPYALHDYFIYHSLVRLSSPRKIYEMAKVTFKGEFTNETILKWLKVYYNRFFRQQFKRSCVPDGVVVTSLSLSPRTSLKMPSDSSPSEWLKELENL